MAIIQVAGNVGSADLKISASGTYVLVVSIADRRYDYKEKKEETVWIRAVWFGERAEKIADAITKAKILSVTGKENYKIYEGKIDRSIEPMEYSILQFKQNDETTPRNNTTEEQDNGYYPPPFNDDDIPFL